MKLTCDEATSICDKNQYKEATLWEKVRLGIHLFLCNKCGLYTKHNSIMSSCYEIHKNNIKNGKHCLGVDEKKQLELEIKARTELSEINLK